MYRLDGAGKISAAEWIEAADDDLAIKQVRERSGGKACELWRQNQLIARIGVGDPSD